jgi:predicted ATPase
VVSSIRLRNYRNHKDTEIEFGRLTALVGPNSAGKSNVLEAIRCFSELAEVLRFKPVFRRQHSLGSVVRNGQRSFSLRIECKNELEWDLSAKFELDDLFEEEDQDPRDPLFHAGLNWGNGNSVAFQDWKDHIFEGVPPQIPRSLKRMRYLKAIAENLSRPSATRSVPPTLSTNGEGLASVVSYLMTTVPDQFHTLVDQLRDVIPEVNGLRTQPFIPDGERKDQLLYDMQGAESIPAHAVSDGTLIATGLLAALSGEKDEVPQFLMIDDLERGLHPKAQRELVSVLRKILEQRPNLQIVFTTHSPYIIDELDPEETWLLNTDEGGVAYARRLSEHPDAEQSLKVLTTGEFWSAEGEDWVVENRDSNETSTSPSVE